MPKRIESPPVLRDVTTALHMCRVNLDTMRFAFVADKPDMLIEAMNELEKTISDLTRKIEFASNTADAKIFPSPTSQSLRLQQSDHSARP